MWGVLESLVGPGAPCVFAIGAIAFVLLTGHTLLKWLAKREVSAARNAVEAAGGALSHCPYKGCDSRVTPMDKFCPRCGRALLFPSRERGDG